MKIELNDCLPRSSVLQVVGEALNGAASLIPSCKVKEKLINYLFFFLKMID